MVLSFKMLNDSETAFNHIEALKAFEARCLLQMTPHPPFFNCSGNSGIQPSLNELLISLRSRDDELLSQKTTTFNKKVGVIWINQSELTTSDKSAERWRTVIR